MAMDGKTLRKGGWKVQ